MGNKISIITISYNQRDYVEECILSIINQPYAELEYIVIDGDSSDGTKEILHRYEEFIDVLVIGKDSGPANALNRGLERATGDFVGFINSDDYILPEALNSLNQIINSNPDFDVYYGPGFIKDERNNTFQKVYPTLWNVGCFRAGISVIFQQSIFIRKEWLQQKVKFNEKNTTHWDGELLVDLDLQHAKFYRHNVSIGVFRIYPGTISDAIQDEKHWLKFLDEKRVVDHKIGREKPTLRKAKIFWWGWVICNDFTNILRRIRRRYGIAI